ncbi:hypothetical protein A2U01_0001995, partial [Trifolium medium]|nr:hypothetical protein [Trifolium medium]
MFNQRDSTRSINAPSPFEQYQDESGLDESSSWEASNKKHKEMSNLNWFYAV